MHALLDLVSFSDSSLAYVTCPVFVYSTYVIKAGEDPENKAKSDYSWIPIQSNSSTKHQLPDSVQY